MTKLSRGEFLDAVLLSLTGRGLIEAWCSDNDPRNEINRHIESVVEEYNALREDADFPPGLTTDLPEYPRGTVRVGNFRPFQNSVNALYTKIMHTELSRDDLFEPTLSVFETYGNIHRFRTLRAAKLYNDADAIQKKIQEISPRAKQLEDPPPEKPVPPFPAA